MCPNLGHMSYLHVRCIYITKFFHDHLEVVTSKEGMCEFAYMYIYTYTGLVIKWVKTLREFGSCNDTKVVDSNKRNISIKLFKI